MKLTQSTLVLEDAIEDGSNIFRLRAPLTVDLSAEGGLWTCESRPLGILGAGDSQEDALRSFAEDFATLWDKIALASDEELTGDAVRLKHALHAAVKSVHVAA